MVRMSSPFKKKKKLRRTPRAIRRSLLRLTNQVQSNKRGKMTSPKRWNNRLKKVRNKRVMSRKEKKTSLRSEKVNLLRKMNRKLMKISLNKRKDRSKSRQSLN